IAEPLRLEIFRTALLHDIGLLGTVAMEDIQRASSCLYLDGCDDDHAEFGAQLVSLFPDCTRSSEWIKHHHERYDGTGYPDGLRGTRIPLGSRIISVADTWDRLLFAEGLDPGEALTKLEELAGSVLDPQLVEAFLGFAAAECAAGDRFGQERALREPA
ncbi:MAG: HD-GYP domain-containing protein, partial [Rectinemataceae bacterium]